MEDHSFTYSLPQLADGKEIYQLVHDSPPLDLNSLYAYFAIADHFSETSTLVRFTESRTIAGYASGYIIPERPDTLFIWQVAVGKKARGQGLAKKMLLHILKNNAEKVKYIETTITPSNLASRNLFASLAKLLHARINTRIYLTEEQLSLENKPAHEREELYRIGPFEPDTIKDILKD